MGKLCYENQQQLALIVCFTPWHIWQTSSVSLQLSLQQQGIRQRPHPPTVNSKQRHQATVTQPTFFLGMLGVSFRHVGHAVPLEEPAPAMLMMTGPCWGTGGGGAQQLGGGAPQPVGAPQGGGAYMVGIILIINSLAFHCHFRLDIILKFNLCLLIASILMKEKQHFVGFKGILTIPVQLVEVFSSLFFTQLYTYLLIVYHLFLEISLKYHIISFPFTCYHFIFPSYSTAQRPVKRMLVNINYQVILRNNNTLKGTAKARLGQSVEQVKNRVLEQEGIKNHECFQLNQSPIAKVTQNNTALILIQQSQKRNSIKSNPPSRKYSEDSSVYEVSSMDYDDQAKEFLAVEPQKPPIIRGRVQKCNKFLCCFSSLLHLELNITQLKIYTTDKYQEVKDRISINGIAQLRSYRKKEYFFIRMSMIDQDAIDLKFTSKNLCKEWMGYLMQAMAFNKYLNQRRTFSKSESFRNFLKSLNEEIDTRIVTLEESNQLQTIYEELPEEKVMIRESKKFIKLSQFEIKYKIGSGSFSIIYLAQRNKRIFALKQLNKEKLLLRNQMKYAITELKTLIKCRKCKYIIPLYFAFQTPENLYMALEYIPTGDLSQHIKDFGVFEPATALILLTELVYTIQFLHKQKIIYRDLKPENIMIDARGHIALIDFGLAKELDNEDDYAESFLGTPLYLAPERFLGGGSINFKSDIYGVGCIFYQMLHGESPFHSGNYHSLVNKIKNDTPEIRKDLPEDFIFFLLGTLQKDPEKRMSEMSKHKIFSKTNWKQIASKTHKGIRNDYPQKRSSVQLNYKVDEDYNQLTFPIKLVADWQFNYQTQ